MIGLTGDVDLQAGLRECLEHDFDQSNRGYVRLDFFRGDVHALPFIPYGADERRGWEYVQYGPDEYYETPKIICRIAPLSFATEVPPVERIGDKVRNPGDDEEDYCGGAPHKVTVDHVSNPKAEIEKRIDGVKNSGEERRRDEAIHQKFFFGCSSKSCDEFVMYPEEMVSRN